MLVEFNELELELLGGAFGYGFQKWELHQSLYMSDGTSICRTEPGSKFVGGFSKFGGNAISTLLVFNFFSIFSLKKIKQCKIYLLDCMFLLYFSCI